MPCLRFSKSKCHQTKYAILRDFRWSIHSLPLTECSNLQLHRNCSIDLQSKSISWFLYSRVFHILMAYFSSLQASKITAKDAKQEKIMTILILFFPFNEYNIKTKNTIRPILYSSRPIRLQIFNPLTISSCYGTGISMCLPQP